MKYLVSEQGGYRMDTELINEMHWKWTEGEFVGRELDKEMCAVQEYALLHMSFDEYMELEELIGELEFELSRISFQAGFKACEKQDITRSVST